MNKRTNDILVAIATGAIAWLILTAIYCDAASF